MAEQTLTVKQQLNEAAAAVTAAEQRVAAAQTVLEGAQARRLEAEEHSPETAGVVYADPREWRAAMDSVAHAWSLERRASEILSGAQSALETARAQQAAASTRNLVEHRVAIVQKLERRGSEVTRLFAQLRAVDAALKAKPSITREVADKWGQVLGSELKRVEIWTATLPQDVGGRDWRGFEAWSERLLSDLLALPVRKRAVNGSPWQNEIGADETV
jgi:hypothetical protein